MTQASAPDRSDLRRDRQLRDLRFLDSLQETLVACSTEVSIYGAFVNRTLSTFGAAAACLAVYDPVGGRVEILQSAGSRYPWDLEVLTRAARESHTVAEDDLLALPVVSECHPHVWGVLALVRDSQPFASQERSTLRTATERLAAELAVRRDRLLDMVLGGLLRKSKPIDVYMHTLRDVRRFIRYDHSASIMTTQRGIAQIVVRAEKVVTVRGQKETLADSPRRGRDLRLTLDQAAYLESLKGPLLLRKMQSGWRVQGDSHPHTAGLWRVLCLNHDSSERAVLCYPLIFGGQMLGLLRLSATDSDAFEPVERHAGVLERFAQLLAVTLYRSELYHQSDRQLQAIKEIGRAITEPIPVQEICQQVLQLALRTLHVQVGSIGLVTEEGRLELATHQGCSLPAPPILDVGGGIAGAVVATGRARAVPDVTREPNYVVFNARVRSELVAPITYNREVIGFLDVESFEEGRFREEDEEVISFLEALANQAAIAIKTAQLHFEAVEHLGSSMTIDPALSTAGLQDLLIDELRDKIDKLGTANRAKSEFLARMSHDLRGPLNVIVGLANLLTDPSVAPGLAPDKQRESLEVIRSSGEVLSSLIGNILDLSALEAGKVELTVRPIDARAGFAYLHAMGTRMAEEYNRSLDFTVSVDSAVAAISVDEEKFLRIMINLISNAVKFTPTGGRIAVTATRGGAEGEIGELHLTVADTGVGIAPQHHEAIFEPFRRLDSGGHAGTGLGLAVVRQLVDLHGGRVWVESRPNAGAAFHVVLPHALSVPPGADLTDSTPVQAMVAGMNRSVLEPRSKGLILVVEDTEAHLDLMRLAVTSRGYTMHGVRSGEEALAWLATTRPDVILLDMNLPGMDGFEVAGRIKGEIETHSIPLIAVTASALTESEERALASGCDAYLTKPIDIARLLATIESVAV